MGIIEHEFSKSGGLEKEIQLHNQTDADKEAAKYASPGEFIESWLNKTHKLEIERISKLFEPSSKILDVGAGIGHTSIYFATQGHKVTVVEPADKLCVFINKMAEKFNMEIPIHHCSIEGLRIKEEYDICIFNASLHHCEDPVAALKICHSFLRPGGLIYLANEQTLKFYRSKNWYYKTLKTNPDKVCDYGGNEHNYRLHEYRNMLVQADFQIKDEQVPAYYLLPKESIKHSLFLNDLYKKNNDKDIYSDFNIFIRFVFYLMLKILTSCRLTLNVLKKFSLITVTFVGKKV